MTTNPKNATQRIIHLSLDEAVFAVRNPDIAHERKVAIFDLIESNHFALKTDAADNSIKTRKSACQEGPYRIRLSLTKRALIFDVRAEDDTPLRIIELSLTPFRRLAKDYFIICESYYEAIRSASANQIEIIDQSRRALHNEGSERLTEKLNANVKIDAETARRLFTLVCVLQMRE